MRIRPGIQFRLLLLGVLPAGLIGLVLTAYFLQTRIADLERNLDFQGDLIVRELAAASAAPLASGDRLALRDLADITLQQDDVIEVGIFDQQGEYLAARSKRLQYGAVGMEDAWVRTTPVLSKPVPGGQSTEPVPTEPKALGSVKLVLSRGRLCRQRRETVLFSLAVLVGGLLLTALLARRMGKKISEPVVALTLAVHELSKGNLDARAESPAEAELAYLQAGFNAMAAELKKSRDSLEHQVRQATARLQEALAALEKRNQELESARWLAEAQTELKSRFLAQMSHEIRTPMNGILGFAELLAKSPLHAEQAEQLGLIMRSAKNLLAIINDILDLSKLEAGQISVNAQVFALRPCLEDIVSLLSGKASKPAIVLWVEPAVPRHIVGDPVRLQQIVANLLGNALKFTQRGRVVIRVRRVSMAGRGHLMVSVSDSGSGISPQDMAKLFSPFLQLVEYPAAAEKGSGLGLSIAKHIVESMGGTIHLASRLGKGSCFWFYLPLVEADTEEEAPLPQASVGLIEVDRLFRQALAAQLGDLGARVEAFASLDGFIKRFGQAPPPVLMYGLWPQREKADAALPRWLEWCGARRVKPILLVPGGERRMLGFYQKSGAVCLFHPVRSETLAKAIAPSDSAHEAGLPEPQAALVAARSGLRFLVADDNGINRLLLRSQLKSFKAEIVEARNGREALDQMRRQRFDLMFLDLQMPEMDGQQVLRETRDNPGPNRHTLAIAVTAFCAPEQKASVIRSGFSDCLIKPITQQYLATVVNAYLDGGQKVPPPEARAGGRAASPEAYVSALLEKTDGNRELAGVIAHKLFAELPELLRATETALHEEEWEAARQSVHKIHGAAGFSGLPGLHQAAARLEAALLKGRSREILGLLFQSLGQEAASFLSRESLILDLMASRQPTDEAVH